MKRAEYKRDTLQEQINMKCLERRFLARHGALAPTEVTLMNQGLLIQFYEFILAKVFPVKNMIRQKFSA